MLSSVFKGFYFVPKIKKIKKTDYYTKKEKAPNDETVKILDDLLSYLKTTDLKVLFIVSPYEELKEHKMVYNYVEKKVKKNGYDFIDANDYRKQMKLNYKTDFYNTSHVNIYGADKYTRFLENYINKNYNVKDHRKDKKYKSWYKDLNKWKEEYDHTNIKIKELTKKKHG